MSVYRFAAKSLVVALSISAVFCEWMNTASARLDPPPVAFLQGETIYLPSPCGGRRMQDRVRAWSPCERELDAR